MSIKIKEWLEDTLIRLRARPKLYATDFGRYRLSVARTVKDHQQAFRLVYMAYAWLGIDKVSEEQMRITPQHVLPESTVLIVRDENDVLVGTMTITLDSAAGLPLEHDYPDEIAALRAPGRRIVEYGSLAIIRRCRGTGITTLLSMAAYHFARRYLEATHVVMGVNPKAEAVYRAIFNFHPLGAPRQHASLEAPVLGMVENLDDLEAWGRACFPGRCKQTGVSFADYYFGSPPECIQLPPITGLGALARWKLPRSVFRRVFVEGSNRMQTLDQRTRAQLQRWRSPMTTDGVPVQPLREAWAH